MDMSRILSDIDAQITSLQQARAILSGTDATFPTMKAKRGRPKGSGKKSAPAVAAVAAKTVAPVGKRTLSAAGRKAIADAMKKRWAERKKSQKA